MLKDRQEPSFDLLRLALNAAALRCRRGRARARADPGGAAARDHRSGQHRQPGVVAHRISRPSLRPSDQRHARIGADHHRRRPADLCASRCSTRDTLKIAAVGDIDAATLGQTARPRVRRAAGDGDAASPVPDAPMRDGGRADRGPARRAAGRGAHRRRRHHAQGSGFHAGLCGQPHPRRRLVHLAALSRGAREARPRLWRLFQPAADAPRRPVHGAARRPAPTAPARRWS